MIVEFVPVDKEQPEIAYKRHLMEVVPFPGEEVDMGSMTVRVIRRYFYIGKEERVKLIVRALPPEGVL